jgi:hypothetical protein
MVEISIDFGRDRQASSSRSLWEKRRQESVLPHWWETDLRIVLSGIPGVV